MTIKYEFKYEIQCPFFIDGKQCNNEMVFNGSYTTCLGTINGVNLNHISEMFTCKKCGRTFTRTFKWKELEKDNG